MVLKCCVPNCTSNKDIPKHLFPKDVIRREEWIRAIKRLDLIDAPKETVNKLKICTLHFSDDMICTYTRRRVLKDSAIPVLYLPNDDEELRDPVINENVIETIDNDVPQDVEVNSNLNIDSTSVSHLYVDNSNENVKSNINNNIEHVDNSAKSNLLSDSQCATVGSSSKISTQSSHNFKKTVKNLKTLLRKKKKYIQSQKKKIKELRQGNMWDDLTTQLTDAQRIFFEVIRQNLKSKPEVFTVPPLILGSVLSTSMAMSGDRQNIDVKDKKKRVDNCMFAQCTNRNNITERGQRYDAKQKAFALTLYKTMGKHAYTSLRSIFKQIPSIQTLQSVLHRIPLFPGLNSFILRHLESLAPNMSVKEKVCILIWDEISVQPKLTYDSRKDIICGFEDWGNNRTQKIADHVLVFMLRGLHSGWKLPISYNFCHKVTNVAQLMRCVKEHVEKVQEAGFHIVASVCDQGTTNVAAIKELVQRSNIKRNKENRVQSQTFEVENAEIIPLYDPSHLIKGIRNNLLTKDLAICVRNNIPERIGSWDIIKCAWLMDRNLNIIRPHLKHITQEHIIEEKIKKMRVKHAVQVLSGRMASVIETFARTKVSVSINNEDVSINEEEGLATMEAVYFFNQLFDSVNGDDKRHNDNELRCPVTETSEHHAFWCVY